MKTSTNEELGKNRLFSIIWYIPDYRKWNLYDHAPYRFYEQYIKKGPSWTWSEAKISSLASSLYPIFLKLRSARAMNGVVELWSVEEEEWAENDTVREFPDKPLRHEPVSYRLLRQSERDDSFRKYLINYVRPFVLEMIQKGENTTEK